jgi:hypothetical protein
MATSILWFVLFVSGGTQRYPNLLMQFQIREKLIQSNYLDAEQSAKAHM